MNDRYETPSFSLQEPDWQIALAGRPIALVNCPPQKLLQLPDQRNYCRNDVGDSRKILLFSHMAACTSLIVARNRSLVKANRYSTQ